MCACAASQLGEEKLGKGKVFTFKSRKKHNVYKECSICQERRLAVASAIATRQPRQIIVGLKARYAEHLQWMIKQRHKLDQITYTGMNEGITVEDGDKCGDSCLYLPATYRMASANTSIFKYRLSLQARHPVPPPPFTLSVSAVIRARAHMPQMT